MASDRPIVVKLGGSFAYSDYLQDWIEALAACAGRVVVVPGGGPFDDAVRLAQRQMRHRSGLADEPVGVWARRYRPWRSTQPSYLLKG